MKAFSTLCVLVASASSALAHYNFEKLIINGKETGAYEFVRRTTNSNSPITDLTSNDIRCNQGGGSGASTSTATVAAGDTLGFYVNSGIGHPGPLNVYLSKAPSDAKSYDGSGDWFKIWEQGPSQLGPSALKWKSDGWSTFNFKIPASVPAGEYLLRADHIGLHGAGSAGGAQVYIGCAQIKVTGSGRGSPTPTVKFPGAYKANDPGLLINIYWPVPTSYTMPGPKVWADAAAVNPSRRHAKEFA